VVNVANLERAEAQAAADTDLLKALGGASMPPEPPVRSMLFGAARFEQHGRSLAETYQVDREGAASTAFFPRLQDNIDTVRRARQLLEQQSREGLHLGPAGR
jgi:cyclic beta-1,2-glucan synthetase